MTFLLKVTDGDRIGYAHTEVGLDWHIRASIALDPAHADHYNSLERAARMARKLRSAEAFDRVVIIREEVVGR